MGTYKPMDALVLSWEGKEQAFDSLLFIIKMRNGTIKANKVAVDSKQYTYNVYDKSKDLSLTANNDSVFLTGLVDTHEGRTIRILEITTDFLHADNDQHTLIL